MFKYHKIIREFRKDILTQPLYKPVEIKHEGLGLDMSQSLIDSCHLIHKSMIGVLQLNWRHNELNKEIHDFANKNSDYIAAVYLHVYFTQWLSDVKKTASFRAVT